jgi:hypothetical protein
VSLRGESNAVTVVTGAITGVVDELKGTSAVPALHRGWQDNAQDLGSVVAAGQKVFHRPDPCA